MKELEQQNFLSSSDWKNTMTENKKIGTHYEGIL